MPSKNDLSALKIDTKNMLVEAHKLQLKPQSAIAGRKPKLLAEKQSELVGLRFTPSELELIKTKAGLIPVATYLKDALSTRTDILK